MLHFLLGATVLAACAAWTDLRRGVIPNPLTLFAFSGALGAHFVRGTMAGGVAVGLQEVGLSLAGATVCAVVPLFMFLRGAMGAGDVKLFAALGAALHPLAGLEAETYAPGKARSSARSRTPPRSSRTRSARRMERRRCPPRCAHGSASGPRSSWARRRR